jgi:hypothetical protein
MLSYFRHSNYRLAPTKLLFSQEDSSYIDSLFVSREGCLFTTQLYPKVKVMLRPTVSRSICGLVSSPHLGLMARFLLLSDSCVFVEAGRLLWREEWSVVYNCCWTSPALSFWGLSPAGFMTLFYCLRLETPQPEGSGRSIYTPPRNRMTQ